MTVRYVKRVAEMLNNKFKIAINRLTTFTIRASLLMRSALWTKELAGIDDNSRGFFKQILHIFMPSEVLQVSAYANNNFPILRDKGFTYEPLLFLYKNYACQAAVRDVNSLLLLLKDYDKFPDRIAIICQDTR